MLVKDLDRFVSFLVLYIDLWLVQIEMYLSTTFIDLLQRYVCQRYGGEKGNPPRPMLSLPFDD